MRKKVGALTVLWSKPTPHPPHLIVVVSVISALLPHWAAVTHVLTYGVILIGNFGFKRWVKEVDVESFAKGAIQPLHTIN